MTGVASNGVALPKPDPELAKKIDALIVQWNDNEFEVREKAGVELCKIGKPALSALIAASSSTNGEVQARAKQLLQHIGWDWETAYARQKLTEYYKLDAEPERIDSPELQKLFPQYHFYGKQQGVAAVRYAFKFMAPDAIRIVEHNVPGAIDYDTPFERISAIARDSGVKLLNADDVRIFHRAIQPLLWREWVIGGEAIEKTETGWICKELGMTYVIETNKDSELINYKFKSHRSDAAK